MSMEKNGTYLGDRVYLRDDGWQLWLSVNGSNNDVVALDARTFDALVREGAARFAAMNADHEATK